MRFEEVGAVILAALVFGAGCQGSNGGRAKESPAVKAAPRAAAPASKAGGGASSSSTAVSVATRDGDRVLDGQLERTSTRVTAGPPVWHYHMRVRNHARQAALFEYRIRFHDGYGREHRTFGSYKWRPERIDPASEKEFAGEMPWVRVNTIAFEARPVGSKKKAEMEKAK